MNSSSASDAASTVRGSDPAILQGILDHTVPETYGRLILMAVFSIISYT